MTRKPALYDASTLSMHSALMLAAFKVTGVEPASVSDGGFAPMLR